MLMVQALRPERLLLLALLLAATRRCFVGADSADLCKRMTSFVALSGETAAFLAPLVDAFLAERPIPPRWQRWLRLWTTETTVRAAFSKADAAVEGGSSSPPALLAERYLESLALSLGDAREVDSLLLERLARAAASCEYVARRQGAKRELAARHREGLLLQELPEYVGGERSCTFPTEPRSSTTWLMDEHRGYVSAGRRRLERKRWDTS